VGSRLEMWKTHQSFLISQVNIWLTQISWKMGHVFICMHICLYVCVAVSAMISASRWIPRWSRCGSCGKIWSSLPAQKNSRTFSCSRREMVRCWFLQIFTYSYLLVLISFFSLCRSLDTMWGSSGSSSAATASWGPIFPLVVYTGLEHRNCSLQSGFVVFSDLLFRPIYCLC